MDELVRKVTANAKLSDSSVILLHGISDRLEAIKDSPGAISAFARQLRAQASEVASAIAQNTHAAQPGVPLVDIAKNEAHGMVRPPEGTIGAPGDGSAVPPGSPNAPGAPIQPPYSSEAVPNAESTHAANPAPAQLHGTTFAPPRPPSARPPRT